MLDRNIAPPVRDFDSLAIPPLERILLDNGTALNIMDQGAQEVFSLTAVWAGGNAECASPSLPGIALQLMREGAGNLSGEDFSDFLEFNGARIGMSADTHYSTIRLYALNSKASNVVPLVAAMCHEPLMPENAFLTIRERQALQAELSEQKVEPMAAKMSNRLMMGDSHPVARFDSATDIEKLSVSDAVVWHDRIFRQGGGNLELFVSGRIDGNLISIINDSFGKIPATAHNTELRIIPFSLNSSGRHGVTVNGALQSAVRITYPGLLRSDHDYIPLRLLVVALGGYFGSRLMSNIREDKGLTYGISSFMMGYPEGGIIGIESSTDPASVDCLIDETLKEVKRLSSGDFTSGEITRLKRYLMSSLASTLDSPFDMMDFYVTQKLSHIPEGYFAKQVEAIAGLSPQMLGEMARKYIEPHSPTIVVAGA